MYRAFCDLCKQELTERFTSLDVPDLGKVEIKVNRPADDFIGNMFGVDVCAQCGPTVLRKIAAAIETQFVTVQ